MIILVSFYSETVPEIINIEEDENNKKKNKSIFRRYSLPKRLIFNNKKSGVSLPSSETLPNLLEESTDEDRYI